MAAENLNSKKEDDVWKTCRFTEVFGGAPSFIYPLKITGNGNSIYGFAREGASSITIPVVSSNENFIRQKMCPQNQKFLRIKTADFSPEEIVRELGFHETRTWKSADQKILVCKYQIGRTEGKNEVGITIRPPKQLDSHARDLSDLISSELKLSIEPITINYLDSLK